MAIWLFPFILAFLTRILLNGPPGPSKIAIAMNFVVAQKKQMIQ